MTDSTRRISWLGRLILGYAKRPLMVRLRRRFGEQPNDRDRAEEFCRQRVLPALSHGRNVVVDFAGTGMVTQSFIHALVSEAVKQDDRWATRIELRNGSKAQVAVFNLALRHMITPPTNRPRNPQPLQPS